MADSRTWWPDPVLDKALRVALAELGAQAPLAVALSGGADSAMLAVHAASMARAQGRTIRLFHVHHGLQDAADSWAGQVEMLAEKLALPLDLVRVSVDLSAGLGVEAAARNARYGALADLAHAHGVPVILLAHHRHDQAETLLLRLLRGTGPQGMVGMAQAIERDGVRYLRPWLNLDRSLILAQAQRWAQATGWQPVADPTNADTRYARGAVRALLAPVLDARWPSWRDNLARHAHQAADVALILDEVAQEDFSRLEPSVDARSFSLSAWRGLAPAHQALVLRYWFARHGAGMPSQAKLAELMRQLRQLHALGYDRKMCFEHGAVQVRCVHARVQMVAR